MTAADSLGDRMKGYEKACRTTLPRRIPVILRLDGKAFHTLTRDCERPFDRNLADSMLLAAEEVCGEIQGAKLAYVQSDEISILIHNYTKLTTQPWFDNQVQKMCSVAASVCSVAFSYEYGKSAYFDARVFVLPEAEVCNYFIWRQQDAIRNSVQMLARSLYSHAKCENKNCSELQEMCFQAGRNWNDIDTRFKRGSCIVDGKYDENIPVFTEDRAYIERHLACEE